MTHRRLGRALLVSSLLALAALTTLLVACEDDDTRNPTPAASAPSTPTSTSTATATPASTPTPAPLVGRPPPRNVRLSGPLPDPHATVPPGEGELGRVTVGWDASGADGFRIYLKGCDGTVRRAAEVGPAERSYGPLQPCRPGGNIGVSAFDETGESEMAWAG